MLLLTLLLCICMDFRWDTLRTDPLCAIILKNNQQCNLFLTQDSLTINSYSIKTIVYFGYEKDINDSLKWDDILKIYRIKNNKDTILSDQFTFIRGKYEGIVFLTTQSSIPDEKIIAPSFIVHTAISDKGNFSENNFVYDSILNRYSFEKRVNYITGFSQDTIGLKTIFFVKK